MSAKRLGAWLIAEGLVLAAARFLTLVYVFASETYLADEEKIPLANFLPWLGVSFVLVAVLMWAGMLFRRSPEGPWAAASLVQRGILIAAFLFNAAVAVRSAAGFAWSLDRGAEILIAWAVLAIVPGIVAYAMVRGAGLRTHTVPG